MKTPLILWALVALGLALIVQLIGPYLIGAALAYALHRYLRSREP